MSKAKKEVNAELKNIPTVLAYSKSLESTPALMFASLNNEKEVPIELQETIIKGAISDYASATGQNEKNTEAANIQSLDYAIMPQNSKALKISFGLKVIGNSMSPFLCNNITYENTLKKLAKSYAEKGGYSYLASKYLHQIFLAKWGWRNLDSFAKVTVTLNGDKKNPLVCNSHEIESPAAFQDFLKTSDGKNLLDKFTSALAGKSVLRLKIDGEFVKNELEEVWPSQEFAEKEMSSSDKPKKTKYLYSIPTEDSPRHAALHSQKVGNALRTIDDWWSSESEDVYPIAVEPLGYISSQQRTVRSDSKNDLYSQLKQLEKLQAEVENAKGVLDIGSHIHHVMSCLIRGGVFGMKEDDKKDKNKDKGDDNDNG
ncbi:type I-F CRISPR-associated protein Csy3 [Fluviispira sanaruensis]|uniref:Type I-F CRISPR-associated protein Csy3 n=1 Tax=Fluviispira sanaruensis TaxID=2493639 RepID=A0A4P2VUW1_FLUSA|nr:type I-F CRISPR-associated protein Csy3 [Fluviispira sanaruensis]BBH52672.1 type I-F CRISPR-associated protein Csy3 [Fluviispira sanaruensis]